MAGSNQIFETMKKLLVSLLLGYLVALSVVYAGVVDEKLQEIADLEKKVVNLHSQAKTLTDQIVAYDSQIRLAQLKITQTEERIKSVTIRISQLEDKLRERSALLEKQIVQTYKKGMTDPLQIIFGSKDVSGLLSQIKYLQIVQSNNRKFLYDTQLVQTNYAQQKTLIEESKKKLQTLKASLDSYSKERSNLLIQTKNSEAYYQKLLIQAKAELDSLKAFAQFRGGGILPAQPSPDGWYFNQRDERWGRLCIGTTCGRDPEYVEYVWEVGCLITDVAMIKKKYGQNVTPANIASDTSYFVLGTAYMLHAGLRANGFFVYGGNRIDLINNELDKGKPVIVHLTVHTNDGHYVVLKSKNGSDYIMNDPWEGSDLNFSKYYTINSINQVITYSP